MNKQIFSGLLILAMSWAVSGCIVSAQPQPVVYSPGYYGYTTYAAPNTVYYRGGYYNQRYYPAGYYYRHAPFVTTVVTQPTYAQPAPVQSNTVVVGSGAVGVGGVGVSGGVRVGSPVY
jgi:hypothetical protein